MPSDSKQELLLTLAKVSFSKLSQAESKLVTAAAKGDIAYCGPSEKDDDPANDPSAGEKWPASRVIRAGLIRWLCVDLKAKTLVDPLGIQAHGAKITGGLDLSFTTLPLPLRLLHCRLMEDLTMRGADIAHLDLEASWAKSILADDLRVRASVLLRGKFHADGVAWFMGARINGNLDFEGSTLICNPVQDGDPTSGIALDLEHALVNGNVALTNGFHSEGQIKLLGAQLGGDFDCGNSSLSASDRKEPANRTIALMADSAVVKGSLFLRHNATATGDVSLIGSQVEGDLECNEFTLAGELNAERAVIRGTLFWVKVSSPDRKRLDLLDAVVGSFEDDENSWPSAGDLKIAGFIYGRITGENNSVKDRLRWLERVDSFTSQPYRQLAKVLKDEGNDEGAREVLVEMELRAAGASSSTLGQVLTLPWRAIGYGYRPLRALGGLAVLTGLGWVIYRRAHLKHKMTPTDKDAYQEYTNKTISRLPPHYRCFSPFIYSLENSLPLVKLGQGDSWQPDPGARSSVGDSESRWARFKRWLRSTTPLYWFLWFQIVVGWVLATLFAAGVSGLVR